VTASPRPVLAAAAWPTNADLIADVARLHLDRTAPAVDMTYGRGLWWARWRPLRLTTVDIRALDGVDYVADFCDLPFADATFGTVAFDPPYVAAGGRASTRLPEFFDRYGMVDAPRTPADAQALIDAGLVEAARVCAPGGRVLVKCQDYVTSGRLWPGTHYTLMTALRIGLRLVDRLEHIAGVRPQPPHRRQVHARRNLSTLLVLGASR